MLTVTIIISSVQSDRNNCKKNVIVRLFRQMGDAALPVLISLMYRIPEDTKRELLVRSLNAYAPVLRDKLNEEFLKDTFGTIYIYQQDGILLNIWQITA